MTHAINYQQQVHDRCALYWVLLRLTLLVLKMQQSEKTLSIPWLLMPWLLASSDHHQPWYRLCRKDGSLSFRDMDFNLLRHPIYTYIYQILFYRHPITLLSSDYHRKRDKTQQGHMCALFSRGIWMGITCTIIVILWHYVTHWHSFKIGYRWKGIIILAEPTNWNAASIKMDGLYNVHFCKAHK